MQATNTAPATVAASPEALASAEAHAQAATVAAQAKRASAAAKREAAKAPAKPKPAKRAAKPEAVAKPDKPSAAARDAKRVQALSERTEARTLAAKAVRAYYGEASLPFKAAADTFAPLRTDKAPKRATLRQSALLASMLLAGNNIKRDGTFTRGAFVIDGRNVQPETGALSDMLGRVVHYVSGPLSGANQRDAVFRVDLKRAAAEIREHVGEKLAGPALARLAELGVKL